MKFMYLIKTKEKSYCLKSKKDKIYMLSTFLIRSLTKMGKKKFLYNTNQPYETGRGDRAMFVLLSSPKTRSHDCDLRPQYI